MIKTDFRIQNQESSNSNLFNFRFAVCNRGGFTLLELMISLALIGIIVLIATGAMRLGFRSVDAGERKMETLERTRTSLNIIEAQVQSQMPLTFDENGQKKNYFNGSRVAMQLATGYSIWSGPDGYVTVRYSVESDPGSKQTLYASEKTIGLDNIRKAKLVEGLDAIYFEYFYKGPTDSEGRWVEEWTDDNNIPEKIRLNIIEGQKKTAMVLRMRARKLN